MGDDTAGARRRRRAGSSAAPTSEPEPEETAPPAPEPPVSSSRSRRSRVPPPAEAADSGTEEDESPTQSPRKGRSSLLFRRQDSSRKEALRSQPRQSIAVDEHTPSIFARCFASIRGMIYGSQDQYFLSRFQVAASTPLQMALYFNIAYAIVFAGINQALFFWKSTVWDLPLVVAVVSPMSFWVWALLEPIRLLLGYIGNLRERVAWLGGFWVLTVFPQTILHVYFIVGQASIGWFTLPIEIALSSIYLILLLFELVLGYGTFKRLIAKVCARASRPLAHYAHNRAHYAFSRTLGSHAPFFFFSCPGDGRLPSPAGRDGRGEHAVVSTSARRPMWACGEEAREASKENCQDLVEVSQRRGTRAARPGRSP